MWKQKTGNPVFTRAPPKPLIATFLQNLPSFAIWQTIVRHCFHPPSHHIIVQSKSRPFSAAWFVSKSTLESLTVNLAFTKTCDFFAFDSSFVHLFNRPAASGHARAPPGVQDSVCGRIAGERHRAAHHGGFRTVRRHHGHPQEQEELLPHPLCRRVHRGQGSLPVRYTFSGATTTFSYGRQKKNTFSSQISQTRAASISTVAEL